MLPAAMASNPTRNLETFPNPNPERDYVISFECPEFTCLCPRTGQPDFATIRVEYVPDALCVELKAWKLYLWSYRNEGAFHEAVTNKILDDLVAATQPRRVRVEGDFKVRGGIHTVVIAEYPSVKR
jgi:7-cyano-7-deazaguanine reductase